MCPVEMIFVFYYNEIVKGAGHMTDMKSNRMLELFFRALRGESLSVRQLADEYKVSTRSISRDIAELKAFLAEHRELVGNAELNYSNKDRCYQLYLDDFISSKELFAIVKVLIGCRPFDTQDILALIEKLKRHTSPEERKKLDNFIRKELYHYKQIHLDCADLLGTIWELTEHIEAKRPITIQYNRMDRTQVKRKILPQSILFSDYYFYLIAYDADDESFTAKHYRIDRITSIVAHREKIRLPRDREFDEGYLRERCQFMWPGDLQKIRFEFSGPSVQAILDKIPTARIIELDHGIPVIEAEVFGNGIRMYLLSQGSWVQVLSPASFVEEMKAEVEKMMGNYE